jgi:insulysin
MGTRVLRLANGLEAFLISDKDANKSSLALDVKIGSFNDPIDQQGIAHLLEHMFFMGTTKYPKKNEFHEYLSSAQGFFNASTGLEHTNYRFEIDHNALGGAVERFSEFFKTPLFNARSVEAEKRVIDSEFKKNYKEDALRQQRVFNITCKKGHPITQIHHGNMASLKNVGRNQLLDFFNLNYSPELMKLAFYSKFGLDQMEELIKTFFSDIKRVKTCKKAIYGTVFDNNHLPALIRIKSVNKQRSFRLCFEIPSLYKYYRSKPNWIIAFLLNTTRKGSLAGYLKEQGLAKSLWASTNTLSFTGFLFVDLELTEKGENNIDRISEAFFAYISMMKKVAYPEYIFHEQKKISDMGYRFKEVSESYNRLKDIAKNMHYYPAPDTELFNDVLFDHDTSAFNEVLACIRPDSVKIMRTEDGLRPQKMDKSYGIGYSLEWISARTVKKWDTANITGFEYPLANLFITDNFDIVDEDTFPLPHKIIDDDRSVFWFVRGGDDLPLSYLNFYILSNKVNTDPKTKLTSLIYVRMVQDALSDISDMAGDAGLSFAVDRDDKGLALFFVGYSDKLSELIKTVIEHLRYPVEDKTRFKRVLEEFVDDYKKINAGPSYDLAQYAKYSLVHEGNIHFSEYKKYLDKVTIADVKKLASDIYKEIFIEAYVCGNYKPSSLPSLRDFIFTRLAASPLPKIDRPKDKIISYPMGKDKYIRTKSKDNCWTCFIEFGPRSTRLSAIIQVGHVFLESFFFNELRNKKQMAYIVESRVDFFEEMLGISFSVVSSDYSTCEIAKEAQKVLKAFVRYIDSIEKEQLLGVKQAFINRVKKKNRTLEEWMSELILTAVLKGNNNYANELCHEVEKLSLLDIKEVYSRAFKPKNRSSVSVHASAKKITC